MANIYVRSTDGLDTDSGATWALAKATLSAVNEIDAAGDTIFISQNHNESTTTNAAIDSAGTVANPITIIAANDSAEPPTTAATANITTTASGFLNGYLSISGLNWTVGSGSTLHNMNIQSNNGLVQQLHRNSSYYILTTATAARVNIGAANSANNGKITFENCTFRFSESGQGFVFAGVFAEFNGGGIHASSTALTTGMIRTLTARQPTHVFNGFDMAALGAGANLIDAAGANNGGRVYFRNCKLPASWTGSLMNGACPVAFRAEMHNCDSADTNYRLWIEDYAGSIKSETTLVRSSGANDGTTPLSWKMATNASARYPATALVSGEIVKWNDTVAAPVTATLEIMHDSLTALTDGDIWIEVQYLGTSGAPLGAFITDAKASFIAPAAPQTASTATWTTTGIVNANRQKLSVTFTPQEKGFIHARVYLAKPSTTVYVDPLLTVA